MRDDRMDETVREMVRSLDAVPEPPREAIWQRIEAQRALTRRRAQQRRLGLPAFAGAGKALRWAPALAATLALGIALGRWTERPANEPAPGIAAADAPAPEAASAETDPYTVAALRHLGSAEALLVGFPQDAREGRTEDVARWAGELLTDTRLLADSPAGNDPEIGRLLGDLELVLAQIAALRADPRTDDVRLIEAGIDQNDVLVRLRAAAGDWLAAGL